MNKKAANKASAIFIVILSLITCYPSASYTNEWIQMDYTTLYDINAVWGISEKEVFAVGEWGLVLFYNGGTWSTISVGAKMPLHAIWGTSTTDIFIGGEEGVILHYNGTDWSEMQSGTEGTIYSIWGSSSADVYAAGGVFIFDRYGTPTTVKSFILHYDGTQWSEIYNKAGDQLYSIWGFSPEEIFAVGVPGRILQYNGTTWNELASSTHTFLYGPALLYGIWGNAADDVFVAGWNIDNKQGLILHYDGTNWSSMESITDAALYSIWGTSQDNMFAAGGLSYRIANDPYAPESVRNIILHYDGTTWSEMEIPGWKNHPGNLKGIYGFSLTDVFAVGEQGTILHYAEDLDNDGIPDVVDECPESNLEETITIGGCDTGVANEISDEGCTRQDLINDCIDTARNKGAAVMCVAHLTNVWKRTGLITGKEKGKIQSCAAKIKRKMNKS